MISEQLRHYSATPFALLKQKTPFITFAKTFERRKSKFHYRKLKSIPVHSTTFAERFDRNTGTYRVDLEGFIVASIKNWISLKILPEIHFLKLLLSFRHFSWEKNAENK